MKINNKYRLIKYIFTSLIALYISTFIINKIYIEPKRFRKAMFELVKKDNSFNSNDLQIKNYVNCISDKLLKKYSCVEKIPNWEKYDTAEKRMALDCIVSNLISDTATKNFVLSHYDTLLIKLWK